MKSEKENTLISQLNENKIFDAQRINRSLD